MPCKESIIQYPSQDKVLFQLENTDNTLGCSDAEMQDHRYRLLLPDFNITEENVYAENGILDVITHYVSAEMYYPEPVALKLYGRVNFVWNPACCSNLSSKQIEVSEIDQQLKIYQVTNTLLMIVLALAFSQALLSGLILNFSLVTPYIRHKVPWCHSKR